MCCGSVRSSRRRGAYIRTTGGVAQEPRRQERSAEAEATLSEHLCPVISLRSMRRHESGENGEGVQSFVVVLAAPERGGTRVQSRRARRTQLAPTPSPRLEARRAARSGIQGRGDQIQVYQYLCPASSIVKMRHVYVCRVRTCMTMCEYAYM